MKHTLKSDGKIKLLVRDGEPLVCPFIAPLPVKSSLAGGVQFARTNCGSHCPHFGLVKGNGGNDVVNITCGSIPVGFEIESASRDGGLNIVH